MNHNKMHENVEEADLKTIAQKIFAVPPNPLNAYKLCPENNDTDYVFQVLLTFFMEGIFVRFPDWTKEDFNKLSNDIIINHLNSLNIWFSFMDVDIVIHNINDFDDETKDIQTTEHYCKIILKNGPDKAFFQMRQINEPYFMLGNSHETVRNDNQDYWALINIGTFTYRIAFDFI